MSETIIIRQLGMQPYLKVLEAMRNFTKQRNTTDIDEVWLVHHPMVFTKGRRSKDEYILDAGNIPIIQTDRGGKITYHGPGQQIVYVMLNLFRYKLSIRHLVTILEKTIIATLAHFNIKANLISDAPGVYVGKDKICSIGLRIHNGCSYHGLALNVSMDISPFMRINPCGYIGLKMVQVKDFSPNTNIENIVPILLSEFLKLLNINSDKVYKWDYSQYKL